MWHRVARKCNDRREISAGLEIGKEYDIGNYGREKGMGNLYVAPAVKEGFNKRSDKDIEARANAVAIEVRS